MSVKETKTASKSNKKFLLLTIILSIVMAGGVTGVAIWAINQNDEGGASISAPTEVRMEGYNLRWNPVLGISQYDIEVVNTQTNETEIEPSLSTAYSMRNRDGGVTYDLRVRSRDGENTSAWTSAISFTPWWEETSDCCDDCGECEVCDPPDSGTILPGARHPLSAPTNVRVYGERITWNAVPNASNYRVSFTLGITRSFETTWAQLDFSGWPSMPFAPGTHSVRVQALADPDDTRFSDSPFSATPAQFYVSAEGPSLNIETWYTSRSAELDVTKSSALIRVGLEYDSYNFVNPDGTARFETSRAGDFRLYRRYIDGHLSEEAESKVVENLEFGPNIVYIELLCAQGRMRSTVYEVILYRLGAPTGLTAVYDQTLEDISLPSGWAWVNPYNAVGNIGDNTFAAEYTFTGNIGTVRKDLTVTVVRADLNPAAIPQREVTFGQFATIGLIALPEGWRWHDTDAALTVGNANEGGAAYTARAVYIRSEGNNYNTLTRIVQIRVNRADPVVSVGTLPATFGQTLNDVVLPTVGNGVWTWVAATTTAVGNAGQQTHQARFTPNDTTNYNIIEVSVTVIVAQARPVFDEEPELTATFGQTLADVQLPEELSGEWTWDDALTTSVGNVGPNIRYATFTPFDTTNFITVSGLPIIILVSQALPPDVTAPEPFNATYGDTLADLSFDNPSWAWVDSLDTPVGVVGYRNFAAEYTREGHQPARTYVRVYVAPAAAPSVTAPSTTPVVWASDRTLAAITLPSGWAWVDDTTPVGNVGSRTFNAIYTRANHLPTAPIAVSITVTAADAPDMSAPILGAMTWMSGLTLGDIDLGTGWAWVMADSTALNAGANQPFYAIYTRANHLPTAPIAVSVTVNQAIPTYTIPTIPNQTFVSGRLLSAITLPANWAWVDGNQEIGDAGIRSFAARYTPSNNNFYTVDRNISVTVNQATPQIPVVDAIIIFGDPLQDSWLTDGWTWVTPGAAVGNAGEVTHQAIYAGSLNFEAGQFAVSFTVGKATPSPAALTNVVLYVGQTLSCSRILDAGWTWDNPTALAGAAGNRTHNATFTPSADLGMPGGTDNWHTVTVGVIVQVTEVPPASPEWVEVAAGGCCCTGFSMAIDSAGNLWAWGSNDSGRLGNGGDCCCDGSNIPINITGAFGGATIGSISAGTNHSMAIDSAGNLWAWGWNNRGQLGNGNNTGSNIPINITGAFGGATIESILAGGSHSMAIDSAGNLWAWGWNNMGQLGTGGACCCDSSNIPINITELHNGTDFGGATIESIAAGGCCCTGFSMAIDSAGNLWAWGGNYNGKLGNGNNTGSNIPINITELHNGTDFGSATIGSISTGYNHSMAIDSAGNLWAWGDNIRGQLGNGKGHVDYGCCCESFENIPINIIVVPRPEGLAIEDECVETNTVTLTANGDLTTMQFTADGGATWQDSPVFTGLEPLTTYNFAARFMPTATSNASPWSAVITVTHA